MFIQQFNRMENCGIFRNFDWPADLHQFSRYNLIYGYNWTGKSTLSRVIRSIEQGSANSPGRFKFTSDGVTHSSASITSPQNSIKVFNRDYISDTVFSTKVKGMPAFAVGPADVKAAQQIDRTRKLLTLIRTSSVNKQVKSHELQQSFDQFGTDQARTIRTVLTSLGLSDFINYTRPKYIDDIETLPTNLPQLDETHLEELKASIQVDEDLKLLHSNTIDSMFTNLVESTNELLQETPTGRFLQRIAQDPEVARWVAQGFTIHTRGSFEHCLFCDQQIPPSTVTQLEEHFNQTTIDLRNRLETHKHKCTELISRLKAFETPHPIQIHPNIRASYELLIQHFAVAKAHDIETLTKITEVLSEKIDDPIRLFEISTDVTFATSATVVSYNETIENHNIAVTRLTQVKHDAIIQYKHHLLNETKDRFDAFRTNLNNARRSATTASRRVSMIEQRIADMERQFDPRVNTAEMLTNDLQEYLGHQDLKLMPVGNYYQVTRGGESADRLSEGEVSAIALMYFLRSLQAENVDLEQTTVVLDDPVNSMDTNSLNNAVAFIKYRVENAGQLFVLTHNFVFMRESLKWIRQRRFRGARQYFMVRTTEIDGQRVSSLVSMDRTLVRFHSEYHYMFKELMDCSTQTTPSDIHSYYHIPNFCRRVLETFAGFRFPNATSARQPYNVLRQTTGDNATIDAIQRFTDELSHGNAAGGPDPEPLQLTEAPRIAKDVLKLIKTIDNLHYEEMCNVIDATDEMDNLN